MNALSLCLFSVQLKFMNFKSPLELDQATGKAFIISCFQILRYFDVAELMKSRSDFRPLRGCIVQIITLWHILGIC